MHYIAVQAESPMRIVPFSALLSKARDLGEWVGADNTLPPTSALAHAPTPLENHIQSYGIPHFPSIMAMPKPI